MARAGIWATRSASSSPEPPTPYTVQPTGNQSSAVDNPQPWRTIARACLRSARCRDSRVSRSPRAIGGAAVKWRC